ncbi:MAG: DEAD/DEAH box helicase [Erysipelotrichales bacterium]
MSNNTFLDYNFRNEINSVLNNIGFENPTKIQQEIIPIMRRNKNVVGISNTGSGKTHAFLLPILEGIELELKQTQAIIIVPTRELAMQINNNIVEFTKEMEGLSSSLIIGGKEFNDQISSHIVVGTPGRLMDAINKSRVLRVDYIKYLVIDEADMIFDSNFIKETDLVMANIDGDVCFSIFSATITQNMYPFLKKYFEGVKIIELSDVSTKNIEHILVNSQGHDKYKSLRLLMDSINPYLCIIFASKKEDVENIYRKLSEEGLKCIQLHGDLETRQRAKTLKRINNLEFNYVVASDIAARGIDINGVSHVISYDMPLEIEYYIHRAGRTGRYKYTGYSYFIYDSADERDIKRLEEKGISFDFLDLRNNKVKDRNRDKKVKKDNNYDKAIVSKVNKKKVKVKPNHKKKKKMEIEKLKKRERQLEIKQRIKAQRKKRKRDHEDSFNDF